MGVRSWVNTGRGSRREAGESSGRVGRDWAWASYECDPSHLPGGHLDLGLPKESL